MELGFKYCNIMIYTNYNGIYSVPPRSVGLYFLHPREHVPFLYGNVQYNNIKFGAGGRKNTGGRNRIDPYNHLYELSLTVIFRKISSQKSKNVSFSRNLKKKRFKDLVSSLCDIN